MIAPKSMFVNGYSVKWVTQSIVHGMMTNVLITGASSGLGEGLALHYAAPGTTLFLNGRDGARLDAVATACRTKGATVNAQVMDVTDAETMESWILAADANAPLDLVIANAGIGAGTSSGDEPAAQARMIFAVNIDGAANTVLPIIPPMRARRSGHIVLVSSQASFLGLGGAPAYGASKAMERVWGEGLRAWLAPEGVKVSVVCPGFVTTRMTAGNSYSMPFLMDVDRAVRIIARGIDRNQPRIAFPWQMSAMVQFGLALPLRIRDLFMSHLPRK